MSLNMIPRNLFLSSETSAQYMGSIQFFNGNQTAVTASAEQTGLYYALSLLYKVFPGDDVFTFLNKNIELSSVLIEAYTRIVEYFGSDPYVELRLIADPDSHAYEQIVAYVRVSLPVAEALELLREFDEKWFLDQIELVGNKLTFDVAFQ